MRASKRNHQPANRSGAVFVETSVVLPVFFMFLFAIVEFGHCFMVIHAMNSAASQAARAGIGDSATTAQVISRAKQILGSAINANHENVVVSVKDASAFDDPSFNPSTINYSSLPDVEVADLPSRSLFIVRVQVPYSEMGILGPVWITTGNLYGQSVMRKE